MSSSDFHSSCCSQHITMETPRQLYLYLVSLKTKQSTISFFCCFPLRPVHVGLILHLHPCFNLMLQPEKQQPPHKRPRGRAADPPLDVALRSLTSADVWGTSLLTEGRLPVPMLKTSQGNSLHLLSLAFAASAYFNFTSILSSLKRSLPLHPSPVSASFSTELCAGLQSPWC